MKVRTLHPWDVTPAEARQIQLQLRERLVLEDCLGRVRRVAGADVAFDLVRGRAIAGVIVYEVVGQACSLSSSSAYAMASLSTKSTGYKPVLQLIEVERVTAVRPLTFPYVPGLLSFREAPVLLAAFARVRQEPDVVFIDGQGYAHPRRFGIACHLGVLLGKPTVGCAKSRLIGTHDEPRREAGSWTPLRGPSTAPFGPAQGQLEAGGSETIGAVLRTRAGVKPIYVSQGHCVSLERAVGLALAVCDGYRIPKPTREADHFVEAVKRRRGAAGK